MQIADGQPLAADGEPGVAGQFAGDEAQQRALAAAIRPDQPHTAVVVDLPRQVFENRFRIGDADAIRFTAIIDGLVLSMGRSSFS